MRIFGGMGARVVCVVAVVVIAAQAPAVNIAPAGFGITGNAPTNDGSLGVLRQNAGAMGNVNDGNSASRVDTFGSGNALDFTGVLFPGGPVDGVSSISIQHAVFFDGGWYGPTAGPGSGGVLSQGDLTVPQVQATNDLGKTWFNVSSTSDYLDRLNAHPLPAVNFGAPTNPGPATFTLDSPLHGINGIRLVGDGGGAADGSGFLGVFEVAVESNRNVPRNIALDGYGVIGHVSVDDGSFGTLLPHAGAASNVNDGNLGTQSDTFSGAGGGDFGGVVLPYTAEGVESVTLVHRIFGDGGWFGVSNNTLPLPAGNLAPPKVQATSDFGKTWFDVNATNDYFEQIAGSGTTVASAPVTFTFDSPLSGVNGFRVLGDGGGTADGNGFIGVTEFAISAQRGMPTNIAQQGTGIIGFAAANDTSLGTLHANAGVASNINDKNVATRVDTFGSGTGNPFDFVGLTFNEPQFDVNGIAINHAIFFDGGWFGQAGTGPGSGGVLSEGDLLEPTVQISLDGVTWFDIPSESNYLDQLIGHPLPTVDFGAPTSVTATFEFDAPDGIMGIRLFGQGGGAADGNGFIGVFEFAAITGQVQGVPEPATGLLGLLGLAALGVRRRRREA